MNFDWMFHYGDIACAVDSIDAGTWQTVDVPHDWSIEAGYAKHVPGGKSNGFLPGGIGWYVKDFEYQSLWDGRQVSILFEGIYSNSTVWLNGHKLGFRPNGYLDLLYDLTPYLVKGVNRLTVKADNSKEPSARWYTGAGIYRNVSLIVTDNIKFAHNATFVHTPAITDEKAVVQVDAAIDNLTDANVNALLTTAIRNKEGQIVAEKSENITLSTGRNVIEFSLEITTPAMWSPDTPNVYYADNTVSGDGMADNESIVFGVRKTDYIAGKGFFLNGEPMKFKGVCLHQDAGVVGTAVVEDIWKDRILTLKEMGCNAIRTSHHPFSREFYTMCDTLGMMVMDELWDGWYQWRGANKAKYDNGSYFLEWWEQDLEEFILRDRNHPSVVIWSLGNEVWGHEKHLYLQKLINDTFHRLDPYHPTTQAWCLGEYIDIAGFNGNGEGWNDIFDFHKKNKNMLAIGTEIPHTRQTRGVYRTKGSFLAWDRDIRGEKVLLEDLKNVYPLDDLTDSEIFNDTDLRYASGYDNQTRRISCRNQWKHTRDNDFFIGEFRWSGYDYLGESWGWPARTNNYGVIDMAGFPKDAYYLYQSFWTETPMVHLLPHWTHPGKEGIEIPVVVYTNCDSAELFLDGKSLGKQDMEPDVLQIVWKVPYKAGALKAVAYRDGKIAAEKSVSTAGKPAKIRLTPDRSYMTANRRDIVRVVADVVDAKGNIVPNADNQIKFEVTGPYRLLGTENGDILDVRNNRESVSNAFMGKTLLLLGASDKPGTIRIRAISDGLTSGSVKIDVNE